MLSHSVAALQPASQSIIMSKGQGCKVFVGGLVRFCLMRLHEYILARLPEVRECLPNVYLSTESMIYIFLA